MPSCREYRCLRRDLTSLRLERAGILPQSVELSQASKQEIKERLLRKQEEAQKEPNPAKSDSDATGTTLEEQTGENMERRRKASYLDHERTIVFLKEVHVMMNKKERIMKEGEVHIVILNQAGKPPIKEKDNTMKMSQGRRLLRGY